ncbi:Major Facilitator Superfamily protein [Streptococcus anginosus]|uniref:Major Facilitator Superfamily protein n=1 Tax=Streptococcus anginosus TaxID=1328 RepID=A0A4U9ZWN5_STRAP|nr:MULTISPECIES: MFS transporter [Streptococcus]VEE13129.1 Major Facilitator Superfamily protein [Streptococcus milleri]VTS44394.1 Major Facilitator Superfamily protein [Streptococcus anginosus]
MKRILQNKLFMGTFVSDMLSNFGDVLYYLALMNYVLLLPEAKFAISLVTLSESLPFLTMIFMGMWGDRTKKKVDTILVTLLFRTGLYLLIGLAMGFQPALWVVILAVLVNLLSDLAGQYEDALHIPLSLRIIPMENREAMYAFRQGASSILKILFQSSGAILAGLMSYQHLAFFNAGTFVVSALIMLILRPSLNNLLKDNPIHSSVENREGERHFIKNTWNSLQQSYQTVQNISILKTSIFTIAGLNAVFAAENALLLLNMKENSSFAFINPATTIATVTVVTLIGNILGSVLVTTLLKKVSMEFLLKISVFMPPALFIGFLLHSIYIIFLVNFLTMVIVGIFQPKMNAFIISSLPEERLATISAGISSFCTLGLVLCQMLVAVLVTFLSSAQIAFLFLILSSILFFYTLKVPRKNAKQVMQ